MGEETGVLAMVENPQPPASLADPQAGFVGTDHPARRQPGANGGAGRGEALARAQENVDQRAFADGKAKHVAHQARQALETDPLREAQIEDEGAQVGGHRGSPALSAAAMEHAGVINKVFPDADLLAESRAFVEKLAMGPTRAYAAHKVLLRAWANGGVAAADEIMFDIAMPVFELARRDRRHCIGRGCGESREAAAVLSFPR